MKKIAFNTANLVARVTGYRFELKKWGEQARKTAEQTDNREFEKICREIRAAGYDAAELWIAHCDPSAVNAQQVRERRKIADDNGLRMVALGGGYTEANLRVAEAMGCESINGGLWGTDLKTVKSLISGSSVSYNYENHPEKTADEVLAKIDGGSDRIGVAIDTGWVGSSGTEDCATFVRKLGGLVRHVHVKDVTAKGGHETCPLGQGVVDLEPAIAQLKSQGYSGWWSWEDEPENRNPFDIAAEMREWIAQRV
jgi:L-ribulose-5-phosphate 3-epimerase